MFEEPTKSGSSNTIIIPLFLARKCDTKHCVAGCVAAMSVFDVDVAELKQKKRRLPTSDNKKLTRAKSLGLFDQLY